MRPGSYLAAAVVALGLAGFARMAGGRAVEPPGNPVPGPSCAIEGACGSPEAEAPVVLIEERTACSDAGYLCRGLEWSDGVARAYRWSEGTPLIRVRVPLPPGDPGRARQAQQAAMRGIRAWNEHPFPILVEDGDRGAAPDFTVQWVAYPAGSQLGQTSTTWRSEGGSASLEVTTFRLSLASPSTHAPLPPRQIELTAAHEMGHALGLPHSDSPRDVMYPTNTAPTLSPQDYKAMEALYRIPNGARIRRAEG